MYSKKLSEQDVIREQGRINLKKVKQAGCAKRAGWNLSQKKLNKQDAIREQDRFKESGKKS